MRKVSLPREIESRQCESAGPAPCATATSRFTRLADPIAHPLPFRHDDGVAVDDVEELVEHAWIAPHVEEAVRFPMAIVQFGDDVAGEAGLSAHRLDLVFERAELLPLRRHHEAPQVSEDPVEAPVGKAVLDSVGVHHALAPVVTRLEPPRLFAALVAQVLRIGQAPIAEFRAHERLVAGDDRVAEGRVEPRGAGREFVDELVPFVAMVGNCRVEMIIRDVRLDVKARRERGIVDHETRRVIGLQPGEGALEPFAMIRVVDEVDAPVLVDDRPDDDRRMVDVAVDDALEKPFLAAARALGRHAAVGQLGPDQHAEPVGDLVVARVRRLDVAAQAIEPEFLGLAKLILQKRDRRDRADRVRVVVLVQGAAEIERLAVEVEMAVAGLDRAKAEMVRDFVPRLAIADQRDPNVIAVGFLGRPGQRRPRQGMRTAWR